jgi:hypothetical protein
MYESARHGETKRHKQNVVFRKSHLRLLGLERRIMQKGATPVDNFE